MTAKFFAGDVAGAKKLQVEAIELIESLFCEVNPIPVKAALNLMGFGVGGYREPLVEMEDKNFERLKKAMQDYGLI
jgi:4-hydroxy-tetrahydrodipicolinate synthase